MKGLRKHQKAKESDKSHRHPSSLHLSPLASAGGQLLQAEDQRLGQSSTQQHASGTQTGPSSRGGDRALPGSGGKEANRTSIR